MTDGRGAKQSGLRARMGSTLMMVLRQSMGAAGLAFILGAACDIALSPLLLDRIPGLTARWAPTGLAWLYLVPVLLAQALAAALRPSLRTQGALEALTQPPAGWARLAWTGPMALAMLSLPVAAIWVHWGFAFAWVILMLVILRFALLPAAQMEDVRNPLGAATEAGLRTLSAIFGLSVAVLAVTFILANLVLGIVLLPISQQAGPDFQPGSGLIPLLQVNLLLALATPGLAAVIAAAWQSHRRRAWATLGD